MFLIIIIIIIIIKTEVMTGHGGKGAESHRADLSR